MIFYPVENEDGTVSIFLGNPKELGREAELICTISGFWIKDLATDLMAMLDIQKAGEVEVLTAERDALRAELDAARAQEPVAVRYEYDGYGYRFADNGHGSDWLRRYMQQPNAEMLYAAPMPAPEPQRVPTAPCQGMNCGCTNGVDHSLECYAEYAASIAGGIFTKDTAPEPRQWQELSKDKISELCEQLTMEVYQIRAISAALRAKNEVNHD